MSFENSYGGDHFAEQLVKIEFKGKLKSMVITIWVCCILLAAGLILYSLINPNSSIINIIIAAASLFLGYFVTSKANTEFEYIFTNGEIDIDRITNKKKRQTMATFKCSSIEKIESYNPKKHIANNKNPNLYFGCTPDENSVVLTIKKPKGGVYHLVLALDDNFKNAIKRYLPYELKNQL